ncbi:MAG: 2-hydroxyacyl-CoA dehydratase [Blastocatellia bacterium]
MQNAMEKLRWHDEHRRAVALARHKAGIPVVGFTANTVPYELIRAAGCFPVLLRPAHNATPLADEFMEPVFETGVRCIFDRVLAGDWSFLSLLVIPRTAEPQHKLYLYLREVLRQRPDAPIPPLHLYDLLHTRSAHSDAYGLARTHELANRLSEITKQPVDHAALAQAIGESNAARAAIRALLRLRRRARPKLGGAEAMSVIGAWNFMERTEFTELATQAVAELKRRPTRAGMRLLIKGIPLGHAGLHRAIEAHNATVVAEDDWHGSRSAGRDIALGKDLPGCVFRKYHRDADSPRVFPADTPGQWFRREALRGIDGVVFYLPPDDDVLGWDYPRQKQFLDEHHIPHLLVRDSVTDEATPALHEQLATFIRGIGWRQ